MGREHKEFYSWPAKFLAWLGILWLNSLPGKLSAIIFKGLHAFFTIDQRRFRTEFRQIVLQTFFTGIEALPLITVVAVLLGTLTITQAMTVMPKVGFGDFFGNLMVIVIIRELGPVLTAFLIAGRSGAALAAYLGNMKVESEADALETMGIDPIKYLVMPALIGGMVALFIMNAIFSSVAIVVGYFAAKVLTTILHNFFEVQMMWDHYLSSILLELHPMDFLMLFLKPALFGALITANACQFGLSVQQDVREVPKATSRSVVYSFISVVLMDLLLSLAYIFDYLHGLNSVL
ncbi:MAG TPA: ABC transporter permease [Fibrobacteraceae bacterium]|nr:ABC transporter permease [Fibrobacteraceae bacterium]